ncbi:MAG: hypothetical protein ACRCU3_02060 [Eubacteriaceae bacterium]
MGFKKAFFVLPHVGFSHGAFGFSGSNQSTFAERASNDYVFANTRKLIRKGKESFV